MGRLGTWAIRLDCRFPLGRGAAGIDLRIRSQCFRIPQMGAVVEFLAAPLTLNVFTDENGYYTATGLLPGLYTLKVTAPSFLPRYARKSGCDPAAA